VRMTRLERSELPFDQPLPFDVFDDRRRRYRRAGETLRGEDLELDWERFRGGIFRGPDVPITLTAETATPCDLYDVEGRLILRAGAMVTLRFLQRVRAGLIELVGAVAAPLPSDASDEADRRPVTEVK